MKRRRMKMDKRRSSSCENEDDDASLRGENEIVDYVE